MRTVTVKTKELIKVLKKNRDLHETEFTEAYEGYRQLVQEALEARLVIVKKNEEKFDLYFHDIDTAPDNHTKDYQNVIDMLELGTEKSATLTMQEYLQFYKNEWAWQQNWQMSNAQYVSKFHGD